MSNKKMDKTKPIKVKVKSKEEEVDVEETKEEKKETFQPRILKDIPTDTEKEALIKKDGLTSQQRAAGILGPGQKYFEAPDGTCVIGESDKMQLWYRKLNNGNGGWINPQR